MPGLTPIGEPLPDFVLPDLNGRMWHRDDLAGRPSVLFLFSSW